MSCHVLSCPIFPFLFFTSFLPPSFFSPLHVFSLPFLHFSLVYPCIPLFFILCISSYCILFYLIIHASTYLVCFSATLFVYFALPPSISIILYPYTYTYTYTDTYTYTNINTYFYIFTYLYSYTYTLYSYTYISLFGYF
jgi:hypothetical protein